MQNFSPRKGQKTGALLLLLVLFLSASACGIRPKNNGSGGQTAVLLDLRQGQAQSALDAAAASGQGAGVLLVGLLEITGPGLRQPVRFLFPDLQFDAPQTILVPSGSSRTFELWVYEIPSTPGQPNTFPATLLVTLTPPELRTVDLTGDDVSLELVLGPDPDLGGIGTYNGDGYIEMDRAGAPEPVPGNCRIVLEATLIDPAFDDLALGPFPLSIGLDPTFLDGEYLISDVPVSRDFKLQLGNPWMGWSGESATTLVGSTTNPNPIDVVLSGIQPLSIGLPNSYVGDGLIGDAVDLLPSGGYGSFDFSSNFSALGVASIAPNTGIYTVIGTLGQDSVDDVVVSDRCSPTDQLHATVYWYMVPLLNTVGGGELSLSPQDIIRSNGGPIPGVQPSSGSTTGGNSLWLYGQGFDANTQAFFNTTPLSSLTFVSYSELNAITPAWPSAQNVDVRVFNPRSNALFPDFKGFDSLYPNAFQYISGGGGNAFVLPPLPGSPDRFKYSPQDEVVRPGNAK